ncbi:hypothetical protein [Serratia sp. N21D137]|uniref:hypothetical protein n=1 Tax=Serratia sp. N21D137 TaxID=3397495 RepID=UPI0039E029DF
MRIKVEVTQEELEEVGFSGLEELKQAIIEDLDDARDYPGYSVAVEIMTERSA